MPDKPDLTPREQGLLNRYEELMRESLNNLDVMRARTWMLKADAVIERALARSRRQLVTGSVTVLDPDAPDGPPAYEGPPEEAHTRLDGGVYPATTTDDGVKLLLVVTGVESFAVTTRFGYDQRKRYAEEDS